MQRRNFFKAMAAGTAGLILTGKQAASETPREAVIPGQAKSGFYFTDTVVDGNGNVGIGEGAPGQELNIFRLSSQSGQLTIVQ